MHVLNLFTYSGRSTMAAAKAGAHVVHLDASKGMVEWAQGYSLLSPRKNTLEMNLFLPREL